MPGQSSHTDIYGLFTLPDGETHRFYNAELWARITLILEDAGPVAVSTRQDIAPVLSGQGILLATGEPRTFTLPPGDRLYYVAAAINRVSIIVEPVPWLD